MEIGVSLGQCFISGDIVWFLKTQRLKITEKNPDIFKKEIRNDLTTVVPIESKTV